MDSTGVVVEYNPFHNGHDYHFRQARKLSGADVVIAVMSGNFLQRGEPAIVSKWARAEMALNAGVDLVVELPYAFAVQHADIFARGAIGILGELRCQSFCFGSESGEIKDFEASLNLVKMHKAAYNMQVQTLLKTGMSYPQAMAESFSNLDPRGTYVDLSKPNNILGFQYLQANHNLLHPMAPLTISRKNANYHDKSLSSESIASATAIRKALFEGTLDFAKTKAYLPSFSTTGLIEYEKSFGLLHSWEKYWSYLQYQLLTLEPNELNSIYELEEGIEFRLKRAAEESESFEAFMNKVKTKRYTWTRIQRMCVHILTHSKKKEVVERSRAPEYIRLLGMNQKGREYLNKVKKELSLPLVSRLAAISPELTRLDVKSSLVYAHVLSEPARQRLLKMEYAQPPLFR
ncbi:nucleotidyltransferase [Heyndrickxia acidicola]|uniref:tRNA(Met) cytidine acetate ligase n=1 Tax=Heyndrickxia acidicola TaxID=209389 RepID=A0ABU6MD16_9BACI|nr:nucleotidyltransferase [Heyndrickxia acidicola]MED1202184.1 nucleotidyltransferase [Heyndrickxia acidicola]